MNEKPLPETLLLDARRERVDRVLEGRTRSLVVVLEEVHDPHNVAAVLRTCECFGLQDLYVVEGPRSHFKPAALVTRGAEKWVDVRRGNDIVETIAGLQADGYRVLASRLGGGSAHLSALPPSDRLALVFGNEHEGTSDRAIAASDGCFEIPMFGFTQSLNISVAVAVAVSWLVLHRAQEKAGAPGDLTPSEEKELRRRFYLKAVRQRGRIYGNKKVPPLPRRLAGEEDA